MNTYGWATMAMVALTGTVLSGVDLIATSVSGRVIEGSGYVDEMAIPGETLIVHWSLAKRTDCPGWNSRIWHGSNGFYMTEPIQPTSIPMSGEFVPYNIPTVVPEMAPPGELILTVTGAYKCNGVEHPFELGPVVMTVPG